ncbi:hypothetical protein QO004_000720 [Rhizobium mesoamericanum]|nr:hypothetical protein [Rhizobium mesoamericanum]
MRSSSFSSHVAETSTTTWGESKDVRVLTCAFALAAFPTSSREATNRVPNFYGGQRVPRRVNVQTTVSYRCPSTLGKRFGEQIKAA